MKFELKIVQVLDVDAIRVDVPIDDVDDLATLESFPFLVDGRVQLVLDLNTRKVRDWPQGQTAGVYVKVADRGFYALQRNGADIVALSDYVPAVMPGAHFGDYLILDVLPDGTVKGWQPDPKALAASFPGEASVYKP